MDFRFEKFASHLLAGASSSGKTFRIASYLRLKNEIIKGGEDIQNIVFCYAAWQPIYSELEKEKVVTKWVNKLPSNEEFIELVRDYKGRGGSIVVLDDFMSEISKDLVEIFTVTSRHYHTSTFILLQSLFPPNPLARILSLNCRFFHIFKNPRENAQISYLARQLNPSNYKWIVEAYHEATSKPYTCFVIDLTQEQKEEFRYRSNILPSEWPMKVYFPKGSNIVSELNKYEGVER